MRTARPLLFVVFIAVVACVPTAEPQREVDRERGRAAAARDLQALRDDLVTHDDPADRHARRRAALVEAAAAAGEGPAARAYYEWLSRELLADPEAAADSRAMVERAHANGVAFNPGKER